MIFLNQKILFDNCVIEAVLHNLTQLINLSDKYDYHVCVSTIEELANIPDNKKEKRIKNFISLCKLQPRVLNDAVFILGYSRLNCACLGNGECYKKY